MRHSRLLASALIVGGSLGFGAATSSAALVHRYSFSGNANDAAGTANGTVVGAATISATALTTTGGSGDYVSLPASVGTGITGDFTIEQFVTITSDPGNFSSIFSLSSPGNRNFVLVNPSRPNAGAVLSANFQQQPTVITNGPVGDIEKDIQSGSGFPFGATQADVAVTYVASTKIATVYVNGVSVASGSLSTATTEANGVFNLQDVTAGNANGTSNGINGGGPFGDASINGSTDEFRVYNSALTASQALASFNAGPNATIAIPEPASLGLLGVAGLMAARRRRA